MANLFQIIQLPKIQLIGVWDRILLRITLISREKETNSLNGSSLQKESSNMEKSQYLISKESDALDLVQRILKRRKLKQV